MLDTDTKRRIDSARDILVGKVPDPKSQVEQITIALIYKFMDDMDAESEELGGLRSFFAGDFARYGWAKLMRSGLGGHETLNLYAEAISRMPENPGVPALFRAIFKNAYLPYRDPETLRIFLKVIDEFSYDHSERLGDAFEYLLSVLGSQGDAGQFRTPRHIIDFMVKIVDPKKDEKVLDPACGTAGFLISSYKHIIASNKDEKGESTLTPDEKGNLARNFTGYDISPDMVRLSLVNMYLHGFVDPHIYEYDTLTSQERWNEYADVILANPPFMSPKGGIRPHNRFSVQSKRSEVLFVDYMAEHLKPNGRAAIIVPEGIIFQSQGAYVQLRKMLVDDYLVAVISLPAGVFNPYSGVKTSILILDKELAKRSSTIGFFKVENDGFGLGAQRRSIDKNDIPQVIDEIAEYLRRLRTLESVDNIKPALGLIVPKEKIAADREYNLSSERYRELAVNNSKFPRVSLGEVSIGQPQYGSGASKIPYNGAIRYVRITDITDKGELKPYDPVSPSVVEPEKFLVTNDLLIARSGSVGRTYLHQQQTGKFQFAGYLIRFRIDTTRVLPTYVYRAVQSPAWWAWISSNSKTGTLTNINAQQYASFKFPLPPPEVQNEIMAEIEDYQKVLDGARSVVDNYRPHILSNTDWPTLKFRDAPFEIIDGDRGVKYPKKEDFSSSGYCIFLNTKNVRPDGFNFSELEFISKEKDEALRKGKLQRGDVVLTTRGTIGNTGIFNESIKFDHIRINSGMLIFRPDITKLSGSYLFHFFQSQNFKSQRDAVVSGAAQPQLPIQSLNEVKFPLPPLATQRAIVAEIEAEQKLVDANRELIARFEKKIQAVLARVWGESDGKKEEQK